MMAGIFIGCASEGRSKVKPLVEALEAQGWSVWWGRKSIPVEENLETSNLQQHILFNTDIDSPIRSFDLPLCVCALENVSDLFLVKSCHFHQGGSIYALL